MKIMLFQERDFDSALWRGSPCPTVGSRRCSARCRPHSFTMHLAPCNAQCIAQRLAQYHWVTLGCSTSFLPFGVLGFSFDVCSQKISSLRRKSNAYITAPPPSAAGHNSLNNTSSRPAPPSRPWEKKGNWLVHQSTPRAHTMSSSNQQIPDSVSGDWDDCIPPYTPSFPFISGDDPTIDWDDGQPDSDGLHFFLSCSLQYFSPKVLV